MIAALDVIGNRIVGSRRRPPRPRHDRNGARTSGGARRRQAVGSRVHKRRNGSQCLGDGAAARHDLRRRHRTRLRSWRRHAACQRGARRSPIARRSHEGVVARLNADGTALVLTPPAICAARVLISAADGQQRNRRRAGRRGARRLRARARRCSCIPTPCRRPAVFAIDFAALGADVCRFPLTRSVGPRGWRARHSRWLRSEPLVAGGGQERRRRAGTENIAAIAGFGAAAEAALKRLAKIAAHCGVARQARGAASARLVAGRRDHRRRCAASRQYNVLALPGKAGRDAGDQARSRGHRCQRRIGMLVGQGWRKPCADRHGARTRDCASARSASASDRRRREDDIAAFLAAWKTIAAAPALAA